MSKLAEFISFKEAMKLLNVADENEMHRIVHDKKITGYHDETDYSTYPLTPQIVPLKSIEVEFDLKHEKILFSGDDIEKLRKLMAITEDLNNPKTLIINYAKKRQSEGNPLVAADFNVSPHPEILNICKNYNVVGDTLRRYCSKAKLLASSKTGRKQQ
jgi:hypothetical protein